MTQARRQENGKQPPERDCYVLLQHAFTLLQAEENARPTARRIAEDLGYTWSEAGPLFEHMLREGYLAGQVDEGSLSLTLKGLDYLEREAGRRRGVRAQPGGSAPAEDPRPLGDALVAPREDAPPERRVRARMDRRPAG